MMQNLINSTMEYSLPNKAIEEMATGHDDGDYTPLMLDIDGNLIDPDHAPLKVDVNGNLYVALGEY